MNNRTKSIVIICSTLFIYIVAVFAQFYFVFYATGHMLDRLFTPTEIDEEYCLRTKAYLEEKYKKDVIVDEYLHDYRGAPGVRVHFSNNPDLQFVSYDNYDYYLSTYLEYEAEQIVLKVCDNVIRVRKVSCDLHSAGYKDKELFVYYERNNNPLSWQDAECTESLDFVRIYYDSDDKFDSLQAQDLVKNIIESFGEKLVFESTQVSLISDFASFDFKIQKNIIQSSSG